MNKHNSKKLFFKNFTLSFIKDFHYYFKSLFFIFVISPFFIWPQSKKSPRLTNSDYSRLNYKPETRKEYLHVSRMRRFLSENPDAVYLINIAESGGSKQDIELAYKQIQQKDKYKAIFQSLPEVKVRYSAGIHINIYHILRS